jgi:hypothetical protein
MVKFFFHGLTRKGMSIEKMFMYLELFLPAYSSKTAFERKYLAKCYSVIFLLYKNYFQNVYRFLK